MDEPEIHLEREGQSSNVKMDADEERLLQELTIEPEAPVRRPQIKKKKRRPHVQMMDDVDDEPDMAAFINPGKSTAPRAPPPEEFDHGDHGMEDVDDVDDQSMTGYGGGGGGEMPSAGYSSIEDEKADLLNKLTRLEKKGFAINKRLNAYSSIQELRTEVKRITYSIEVDQSIKFSRRTLIACVTGLEFLNKRYNPLDIHLDGWSESVMENVDDYDGVFEELYVKYKGKMEVAPEIKLIMMLGGSAMMFHLTNSMFKAAIPNMNDVIKQNPGLVQNMMDAVKNTQRGTAETPPPSFDQNGRREMQGPGFDLSALMGGISMPPPPPMNTSPPPAPPQEEDTASVSDIVSVVSTESKKGRGRPKGSGNKQKKEISL